MPAIRYQPTHPVASRHRVVFRGEPSESVKKASEAKKPAEAAAPKPKSLADTMDDMVEGGRGVLKVLFGTAGKNLSWGVMFAFAGLAFLSMPPIGLTALGLSAGYLSLAAVQVAKKLPLFLSREENRIREAEQEAERRKKDQKQGKTLSLMA